MKDGDDFSLCLISHQLPMVPNGMDTWVSQVTSNIRCTKSMLLIPSYQSSLLSQTPFTFSPTFLARKCGITQDFSLLYDLLVKTHLFGNW